MSEKILLKQAWDRILEECKTDPEYAWAVHCNIAVPIMDAIGVDHEKGNVASASVMALLFEHDITTHPYFQYQKSCAQSYFEARLAAEAEEDAQ